MTIVDDDIPEPPLIERPASVSIVAGEVVISGGTQMLVMSPEAALDLAWRINEVVAPSQAGSTLRQDLTAALAICEVRQRQRKPWLHPLNGRESY